jgi:hypothetical protein
LTRRPRITPLHPVHLGRGQISYRVSGAPVSPRYSRRLAPPSLPAPNRAWAGRLMRPSRAALRAGQATGLQSDRICPAIWLRHDAGGSLALHDNSKWRPPGYLGGPNAPGTAPRSRWQSSGQIFCRRTGVNQLLRPVEIRWLRLTLELRGPCSHAHAKQRGTDSAARQIHNLSGHQNWPASRLQAWQREICDLSRGFAARLPIKLAKN